MKKKLLLFTVFGVLGILIVLSIQSVTDFAGRFIYPLDDSYIHLSMAKSFAESGVWGITKHEFSSTTSSPFFTFLLSVVIRVFGDWEYIPLVLNSIAGVLLLVVLHQYLKRYSLITYGVVLLGVLFLMPLHLMIISGMEHVFHTLTMVLILFFFRQYIEKGEAGTFWMMVLFSFLATGFRYESLFFILFICIYLFFMKREFSKSILLGVVSLLPVVIYGWLSIREGSFFLPNSLILKGNTFTGLGAFLIRIGGNIYRGFSVMILFLILLVQIFVFSKSGKSISDKIVKNAVGLVVFGGFGIHVLFANFGWMIRYEAYLAVLVLLAIAPFLEMVFERKKEMKYVFAGIIIVFAASFYIRFIRMIHYQKVASKNIYEQQIQLADFLHQYYPNSRVIVNDIGAISYFNNIYLLDTFGLGSIKVAELRKNDHGKFIRNKPLEDYVKKTAIDENFELAIVYERWVKMPDDFIKVATLSIQNNYICGGPTVTFYAIRSQDAGKLRAQLTEFSRHIPKDVSLQILK
ncbi:hypothetical protein VUJ46_13260 [Chryseobacterium sp. MYb264]|uniref:hypothetical protein n=1 Tax=Chryseobacterium sp. MYb264 TaxID=2745153 RepID=UPI002E0E5E29|nr:hypothetical protein VUJ46_13260 [Chryseobacterium sp. MYb264]